MSGFAFAFSFSDLFVSYLFNYIVSYFFKCVKGFYITKTEQFSYESWLNAKKFVMLAFFDTTFIKTPGRETPASAALIESGG